jgi:hypothetical protein
MLLGYQPTESLVVSCLFGDRDALGLTLRFDLEWTLSVAEFAEELAARVVSAGADAVFLAVYTDEPIEDGWLPFIDLVDELLDQDQVDIREAVLVRQGRFWSYLCARLDCCPPDGTPLPDRTEALNNLEASLVLSGSATLADRGSVVASLGVAADVPVPVQRRRLTLACRDVGFLEPADRRLELAALIEQLTVRLVDPRGAVTDAEAARLAALCGDIEARDDLLVQAVSHQRRDAILAVLRAAVRRVPPPGDAGLCAVLAWFGYAVGDGTLVNVALDRALGSDPGHSLARLIEASLERQLPPSMIEEVVRGAARDIAARDAAR